MFTFVSFVIFFDYLTQWGKILFIYIILLVWDQNQVLVSFPKTPSVYKSKLSLSKLRLENTNKFLNKSGKILGNDKIKFFIISWSKLFTKLFIPYNISWVTSFFFYNAWQWTKNLNLAINYSTFKITYFIYFHGHKN